MDKAKIIELLGLAEDASDEDIETALKAAAKAVEELADARAAAESADPEPEALAALSAQVTALGEKVEKLVAAIPEKPAETPAAPETPPEGEGAATQSGGSANKGSETLAALAAQVETDAKAALVREAVAAGKAVLLSQTVLDKMTRDETAAYLSALPSTLPVSSAIPKGTGDAAPASLSARQAACVAEVRRAHPSWRYEVAWDEAERLHPELFKH